MCKLRHTVCTFYILQQKNCLLFDSEFGEFILSINNFNQRATVRTGPLVNTPTLLRRLGCDPAPVFESVGFNLDEFKDPSHRLSYYKCGRLLEECAAVTGCRHFGLLLGQLAGPSHLGIAGFLTQRASTVGRALNALETYFDLHEEGGRINLLVEDVYCRLSYSVHVPGVPGLDQVCDIATVLMYSTMRLLCGNDWTATQVLMFKSRPDDISLYNRQFRTTMLFDSEYCGIVFPRSTLDHVPPTADQLLFDHLKKEADAIQQAKRSEIREVLPAVLQKALLIGEHSASQVADSLKIRERTLHRRLKTAGTSFRLELDAARESLCKQLLENSNRPISEIATSVGYADSSGFVRAFHNWTGTTPAAWRKQQKLEFNIDRGVSP